MSGAVATLRAIAAKSAHKCTGVCTEVSDMAKEKWETPDFEVIETAFEASMYVYTK
jgi:hypothetical protein